MRCDKCGSKECCGGEMGKRIAELESELAKYKHTPKAYEIMEADMLEAEAERDRLRAFLAGCRPMYGTRTYLQIYESLQEKK